jgi:hypothetical protein
MLALSEGLHPRRQFLRVGSLALGGLSLPGLFAARARASAAGRASAVRERSVVFLFLHGGPPQTETFDPKMDAPSGVRSVTGEVRTAIPGVTFGATFEKLARLAGRLAVVRSFRSGDGNHDIKPLVSRFSAGANLGSIFSRVAGTNHPLTGMPRNVALFPRAVDPEAQPANRGFGRFESAGPLGAAYAAFVPGEGGNLQEDMSLVLARSRLDDRRGLLERLDRLRRALDAAGALGGLDRFQEQAFDTILGGVARAFDLSDEDPRVAARYDTAPLVRPEAISRQWNNYRNYLDNARSLGRLLLLARRLCEAGCGFVTVTTNFVWDFHADDNNATVEEGMRYCGVVLDHAVSAFLEDVEARGLSERILLVACGEMGRTPRINARGGRDHWGGLAPLLFAGGGLKMGQVIGQSDRYAGEPASQPVTIPNLVATVLHTFFDLGELRTARGLPVEIARLIEAAEPIAELV